MLVPFAIADLALFQMLLIQLGASFYFTHLFVVSLCLPDEH